MTTERAWELVFVLPNICPKVDEATDPGHLRICDDGTAKRRPELSNLDLDHEMLRILPSEHDLVEQVKRENKSARELLNSIWNTHRRTISPAALIVRDDAPDALKSGRVEGVVAYRNAVAFSHLLIAWARTVYMQREAGPTWSDFFDFLPTTVGTKGALISHSPALIGYDPDAKNLLFSTSPHLPSGSVTFRPDRYLQCALCKEWHRRYVEREEDEYGCRLFRSLDIAYQAASLAVRNEGSIHEYGAQLSLWLSALEILSGPEEAYTGEGDVLRLIGQFSWAHSRLQGRWYPIKPGRSSEFRGNVMQRICNLAYRRRNSFLHGNPVDTESLRSAVRGKSVSLVVAMPLVFRSALGAFLEARHERSGDSAHSPTLTDVGMFGRHCYDRALIEITHPDLGWNDA